MRVQIDRFEDNGWAVLLLYLEHDRAETERLVAENRRLFDELLGEEG